jgi:DNA (cytosine-5)-methyltransferase 1
LEKSKLRVFEAFSGIGAQRKALENLGIDHEVVAISEIDKHAIASYEAMFGETLNVGDITMIDPHDIPDHDLFTYSFPCQDISIAGNVKGLDKGSGTRSSLLWECEKVIQAKRPSYLVLENVKNLVGSKHIENFEKWLEILVGYGYKNFYQVLNAKHYGVPQNRERVFVISVLDKDLDYKFPAKRGTRKMLKDILEPEVAENYYFSNEKLKTLKFRQEPASELKHIADLEISNRQDLNRVYDPSGISPTLNTMQGGHRQPKIIQVGRGFNKGGVHGIAPTVNSSGFERNNFLADGGRVRKLTPLECWRLMGFEDSDFEKAARVNSNSQLYKQAGNSIVVPVLEGIFENLFLQRKLIMRGISLFASSGIGEFYLTNSNIDIVVANELLPKRAELYRKIYPESKMITGDITNEDIIC